MYRLRSLRKVNELSALLRYARKKRLVTIVQL